MWTIAKGIVLSVLLLISGLIALLLIVYFFKSTFERLVNAMVNRNAERLTRERIQSLATEARERGTVKWFDASGGYGVIRRHTGEDLSVHFSAILMAGFKLLSEVRRWNLKSRRVPRVFRLKTSCPSNRWPGRQLANLARGPSDHGQSYTTFKTFPATSAPREIPAGFPLHLPELDRE